MKLSLAVNKKAIFVVVFFGGILLTSTILFALPPPDPTMSQEEFEIGNMMDGFTKTGTPMDNFPDEQRATFCGVEDAKSNTYVTEYKIPTLCTQPLAIKVTPDGNVWFIESNTGNIARFIPSTEQFTEFENEFWQSREEQCLGEWIIHLTARYGIPMEHMTQFGSLVQLQRL